MKYKVGDKVRVRKDLVIDSIYGEDSFTEEMAMFRGKVVTISKILNNGKYYILEDGSEYDWSWTNEMFEGLAGDEQTEEPEKTINLLREMKHNCEHANKYDDPKRHDKAKALGFAIELIEHGCSAAEPNYKPEKPGETVKLYTWQDLCDYEILLHEKWRIANEQRQERCSGYPSIMQTLRGEYLEAIKRTVENLGHDVPESKVKEWGFGEVNNGKG